jgi:hypothetical protein
VGVRLIFSQIRESLDRLRLLGQECYRRGVGVSFMRVVTMLSISVQTLSEKCHKLESRSHPRSMRTCSFSKETGKMLRE